jgi:hypothetical protein
MKGVVLAAALAAVLAAGSALAQSEPPPLPQLDTKQAADVAQKMSLYRTEIEGRVARGEITASEGDRLIGWRHWQLAQEAAGLAPSPEVPPGAIVDAAPPRDYNRPPGYYASPPTYYAAPPTYYAPPAYYVPPPVYYAPSPYYYGYPRTYYWGPSVCLGGRDRHFGGRICF